MRVENVGKKVPFRGVSRNYPGRDASNIREMGGVQGAR